MDQKFRQKWINFCLKSGPKIRPKMHQKISRKFQNSSGKVSNLDPTWTKSEVPSRRPKLGALFAMKPKVAGAV